jgi:competence protein ComFC
MTPTLKGRGFVNIEFMGLLDLLFPKKCVVCGKFGSYLCEKDKQRIKEREQFCPVCQRHSIGGTTHAKCKTKLSLDGLICLFEYNREARALIHEIKYRFVKDLREVFGSLVAKNSTVREIDLRKFILVPTPLSTERKRWRGFNQSEVLGKEIAQYLKIQLFDGYLTKIKDTTPQALLLKSERAKQMKGSFKSDKSSVFGKNILLFDDVWTTGATMKAAGAELKRKGARRVWGLVVASSHHSY